VPTIVTVDQYPRQVNCIQTPINFMMLQQAWEELHIIALSKWEAATSELLVINLAFEFRPHDQTYPQSCMSCQSLTCMTED
jgi:hypothetical protein